MIKFEKNSNAVIERIKQANTIGFEKAGLIVQAEAAKKAPVDTGRLRASISHEAKENYAVIGTNVDYAINVEFGSSRKAPKGFLRPAILESKERIQKIFQQTIKTELIAGDDTDVGD